MINLEQAALNQLWEALSQIEGQDVVGGPFTELGNIVVCIPKQQTTEQKLMILYPEPPDEWGNFVLLPPSKIEYSARKKINDTWEPWSVLQL